MAFDINKASKEEIAKAFEVNEKRAEEIIKFRDKMGGFKNWDDLKKIPGFSNEMVENLKKAGAEIGGKKGE